MKSKAALSFVAVLALALSAFAKPLQNPLPSSLKDVHRVVCLGDSITEMGEKPGGYVWLLRHYLDALYPEQKIEVINAGVSGHRSNDMLARFQKDVLDPKPDLVTISVGVNDVWHGFFEHPKGDGPRGIPLDVYRRNVEEMVTRVEKTGAHVVLLSTTLIKEDLDSPENKKAVAYNAALRDLAKQHHLIFVDYQRPFRALISTYQHTTGARDLLLTIDGVHMNPEGDKVMTHTLLTALGISPEAQANVAIKIR